MSGYEIAEVEKTGKSYEDEQAVTRPSSEELAESKRIISEMQRQMARMLAELFTLQQTVEKFSFGGGEVYRPVGIKDRRIPDTAMTASSSWNDRTAAYHGRLDNTGEAWSFWHPADSNLAGSWLQVDFGSPLKLVAVITQGRPDMNYPDWVTSYKIMHGNSISEFSCIKENNSSEDMVFQGNRDRFTKVANFFPQPITARYVRLVVVTHTRRPVVRLEYLTC